VTEREVRELRVVVQGTPEQLDEAQEAIMRALCPDPDHEGFCEVPWVIYGAMWAELDESEKQRWAENFDVDRMKAEGGSQ
jgi:hypothetical protein